MCQVLILSQDIDFSSTAFSRLRGAGHTVKIVGADLDVLFELGALDSPFECVIIDEKAGGLKVVQSIRSHDSTTGIIIASEDDSEAAAKPYAGLDVWSVVHRKEYGLLVEKVQKACSMASMSATHFFKVKTAVSEAAKSIMDAQAKFCQHHAT
jgi:hypothetical protein